MSRLILVPQYPTPLRYQDWWFRTFPENQRRHFDEVVVLGENFEGAVDAQKGGFAQAEEAIKFETAQIEEYLDLDVDKKQDILLLCDLSFPGLFPAVLYHKRPDRCFAICHGTSKNELDYYSADKHSKWRVESATASLFNSVFVATNYHKDKLGWKNIEVTGMPLPEGYPEGNRVSPDVMRHPFRKRSKDVVSVARDTPQKRDSELERYLEQSLAPLSIVSARDEGHTSWDEYYKFLLDSKVMLITAKEETFGYQIVDAIQCGCVPIAPNRCSYPELLPKEYLYSNATEMVQRVAAALRQEIPPPTSLLMESLCVGYHAHVAWICMEEGTNEA